jgi:membrane-associated protease RseP (regulator of RpoE activity)
VAEVPRLRNDRRNLPVPPRRISSLQRWWHRLSACRDFCHGLLAKLEANNLHPGILVWQKTGRLLVKAVIPHSPAEEAGIVAGDEIISVNGMEPGSGCILRGWEFERNPGFTILAIRHQSAVRVVQIQLAPCELLFPDGQTISHSAPAADRPVDVGN